MHSELNSFLTEMSKESKFDVKLGENGGYIEFGNTSGKSFILGLSSLCTTLSDIFDNLDKFIEHNRYIEKEWRDLGAEYFTDASVNTMSTVQTKPLFTTLGKLINWANPESIPENPDLDINLSEKSLNTTIKRLNQIIEEYTPEKEKETKISYLVCDKSKNVFAKKVLIYLNNYDKLAKVLPYLKTPNAYGNASINYKKKNLTSIFKISKTELSLSELSNGGKPRSFSDALTIEGIEGYVYVSTEWTGGEKESRLYLEDFIFIINELYSEFYFIKKADRYCLIKETGREEEKTFKIKTFIASLNMANLTIHRTLAYRFVSALQTKPFVILTGLSGSGKTKLAEAFSLWISESPEQYQMVSVGADWTNRESLLGFPNALEAGKYVKPDTGVLDLLLRARDDETRPYFLLLDEMNMSHVERYFADFLSAMESTEGEITLHPDGEEWDDCDVPSTLKLPENLFIIGTVNIDETTYMFSPKVLDRANVIEFRVSYHEMEEYLNNSKVLDMKLLKTQGASMGNSFLEGANSSVVDSEDLAAELLPFFKELQKIGSEFGYRTASEIGRFVTVCTAMAGDNMSSDEIIDAAVMQKLLPKVHGSRNKIEKTLETLEKLCITEFPKDASLEKVTTIKYPLSYEKLERMRTRVLSDGFTSFAEA